MQTFIIDTPRSRADSKSAPFTMKARDLDEALDKIMSHMGNIWFRSDYTLREIR